MTFVEMKKFSMLPPEEKERIVAEIQLMINSKRDEFYAYDTMVKNSLGKVEHIKEVNPALEHLNLLRADIANAESELAKIGRYLDESRRGDWDDDDYSDDDDNDDEPIIDKVAIAKSISGQGVINIRPDVKLFRPAKAPNYKQILEKEAKEAACERRDEIKEIIKEIMNHSHK
jgi:hypothetical protein